MGTLTCKRNQIRLHLYSFSFSPPRKLSVLCHLYSVICTLSFVLCQLYSVLYQLYSVLCTLSSFVAHKSSVLCDALDGDAELRAVVAVVEEDN